MANPRPTLRRRLTIGRDDPFLDIFVNPIKDQLNIELEVENQIKELDNFGKEGPSKMNLPFIAKTQNPDKFKEKFAKFYGGSANKKAEETPKGEFSHKKVSFMPQSEEDL